MLLLRFRQLADFRAKTEEETMLLERNPTLVIGIIVAVTLIVIAVVAVWAYRDYRYRQTKMAAARAILRGLRGEEGVDGSMLHQTVAWRVDLIWFLMETGDFVPPDIGTSSTELADFINAASPSRNPFSGEAA